MKTIKYILFALLFLVYFPSWSAHEFGAGVMVGDPTGLSAKYILNSEHALDAALAFSGHNDFYLHVTYQWLKTSALKIGQHPIDWYFGVGARVSEYDRSYYYRRYDHYEHYDDTFFGLRVPVGLNLIFPDPRVEIFGEISTSMDILPDTDLDIDFAIGVRYYF